MSSAMMRIEDVTNCTANSIFAAVAVIDDFADVDMAEKPKAVQPAAP